jgi:hypothetical protein
LRSKNEEIKQMAHQLLNGGKSSKQEEDEDATVKVYMNMSKKQANRYYRETICKEMESLINQ